MKPKRPSHATVVAYVALFVALGGTAWAALHVGTKQVVNNSLRSGDLRNGKAVGGKDVIPNSLGGRQIDEEDLNASHGLALLAGHQRRDECAVPQSSEVACAEAKLSLGRASRILAIATGTEYGVSSPSGVDCKLEFDGNPNTFGSFANPGDSSVLNSSAFETNGFAMTGVSQGTTGTVIHSATIAVLALGEG